MPNSDEDIIDLTSVDYSISNKPRIICDDAVEVIDLVNDSLNSEETKQSKSVKCKRNKSSKDCNKSKTNETRINKDTKTTHENEDIKSNCSICWERLGRKPLASTKCGHVYCLVCLEKSLKHNKSCPTCRCVLKGASAYHPLYLELG